jgi:hypothetical protein
MRNSNAEDYRIKLRLGGVVHHLTVAEAIEIREVLRVGIEGSSQHGEAAEANAPGPPQRWCSNACRCPDPASDGHWCVRCRGHMCCRVDHCGPRPGRESGIRSSTELEATVLRLSPDHDEFVSHLRRLALLLEGSKAPAEQMEAERLRNLIRRHEGS